ncbi:MAG: tRNA guanosine(34) transglycosylase Tgt [Candidatus Komeilibacteria bacterium]|nr:tRNA guanosine(34) transglycosylase Tgt [Candidatus Komeilibacteria bacterium]
MSVFKIKVKSKKSAARTGVLRTAHGVVHTPFFMPIATKGAVKGLEAHEVADLGAEIILSNTYHLYLQPGLAVLKKYGGLHKFMRATLPILTDSGGFQVFSLSKLRVVDEHGVTFRSHIDGSKHRLTPKKSIAIQAALGSDIMMALDYFPGYPATEKQTKEAVRLTTLWAKHCFEYKKQLSKKYAAVRRQLLFGIVQGSTYRELRRQSAKELIEIDREFSATPLRHHLSRKASGGEGGFGGYAIGGLAVGEPAAEMYKVLDYTVPLLPADKPRYLMGVGYPEQIVEAVKHGIDMFDCVIPTREGRHGRLFVWSPSSRPSHRRVERSRGTKTGSLGFARDDRFYETVNIRNSEFKSDTKPVDPSCDCQLCKNYSRAFLYQMFKTEDWLGPRLATMHNLRFYLTLMGYLRAEIRSDSL